MMGVLKGKKEQQNIIELNKKKNQQQGSEHLECFDISALQKPTHER